jgi:hypothetical protein
MKAETETLQNRCGQNRAGRAGAIGSHAACRTSAARVVAMPSGQTPNRVGECVDDEIGGEALAPVATAMR